VGAGGEAQAVYGHFERALAGVQVGSACTPANFDTHRTELVRPWMPRLRLGQTAEVLLSKASSGVPKHRRYRRWDCTMCTVRRKHARRRGVVLLADVLRHEHASLALAQRCSAGAVV
jgi:hypothetical protein